MTDATPLASEQITQEEGDDISFLRREIDALYARTKGRSLRAKEWNGRGHAILDRFAAPGATAQDGAERCSFCVRRASTSVSDDSDVFPCCARCASEWKADPGFAKDHRPTPTIPAGMVAVQGEAWRIAAWNACRKQGVSQDAAIGFVKALAEEMKLAAAPTPQAPVGQDTVAFVQEWLMSSDHAPTQWDREFAAAIEARASGMTEAMIAQMVSRFLAWKLPADFNPDGGISFKNVFGQHWPVGTNLLTAAQAEEMVRDMLASLNPTTGAGETGEGA